jgi:hypothetical protein
MLLEPYLRDGARAEQRIQIPEHLAAELRPAAEALGELPLHVLASLPSAVLASRLRVSARAIQALKLAQAGVPLLTPEARQERARAEMQAGAEREGDTRAS